MIVERTVRVVHVLEALHCGGAEDTSITLLKYQ